LLTVTLQLPSLREAGDPLKKVDHWRRRQTHDPKTQPIRSYHTPGIPQDGRCYRGSWIVGRMRLNAFACDRDADPIAGSITGPIRFPHARSLVYA
jgi:hypothetical protein